MLVLSCIKYYRNQICFKLEYTGFWSSNIKLCIFKFLFLRIYALFKNGDQKEDFL